jgi:hypothetical protein
MRTVTPDCGVAVVSVTTPRIDPDPDCALTLSIAARSTTTRATDAIRRVTDSTGFKGSDSLKIPTVQGV